MIPDAARLRETLGRPELARLVDRLRTRLERGRALTGAVSLPDATPDERDAINRLLGRPPRHGDAGTLAISLDQVEEKLRGGGVCSNLAEAVERLTGPVVNRRAERDQSDRRWAELFDRAGASVAAQPRLREWLTGLRESGLLRRHGIERAERLMARALEMVVRLPARGIPLAEFAATSAGDAHALDPDRPLAAIVIRAAAAYGGVERWNDAQSRRDAWAAGGLLCDELSAPVLVLNLPAEGDSVTSRTLRFNAGAGEPCFLSVRQILRTPPDFTVAGTGAAVFVCENPSVVAAAANRLGAKCRPLICIDGHPCTATRLLLNRLRAAEIRLLYHGDFDWPGIQIANTIVARHAAEPWRMSAEDYRRSATGELLLSGPPTPASWDEGLEGAMRELGRAVHEEQVLECLLGDLGRTQAG